MAVRPSAPAVLGGGGGPTSCARGPLRVASAYAAWLVRRYELVHTLIRASQHLGRSRQMSCERAVGSRPTARLRARSTAPHRSRTADASHLPANAPDPWGYVRLGARGAHPAYCGAFHSRPVLKSDWPKSATSIVLVW